MKEIWKKVVACIMIFCFIPNIILPGNTVFAAAKEVRTYVDVARHPYEESLLYVIEKGLMSMQKSKFYPDSKLTKGAACLAVNNLFGLTAKYRKMYEVSNIVKSNQYYETVSIGLEYGYLTRNPNGDVYNPQGKATYGYLANIFSYIFDVDMKEEIIGEHDAKDNLTRAEYAVLLQKLAPSIVTEDISKVEHGDVYVKSPNVTLSDVTVNGNLIITEAVDNQEVTLKNVTVLGEIIVRGGGSINILDESQIDMIIVYQLNRNGRNLDIDIAEDSLVESIYIHNKCSRYRNAHGMLVESTIFIKGNFRVITDAADYTQVDLASSEVESVFVTGKEASISLWPDLYVNNVVIEESAVGAHLRVDGEVNHSLVEAKNVQYFVSGAGNLNEVKGTKAAEGLEIITVGGGRTGTVISYADRTIVSGDGTVRKAEIYGEESEVITANTEVIDGKEE